MVVGIICEHGFFTDFQKLDFLRFAKKSPDAVSGAHLHWFFLVEAVLVHLVGGPRNSGLRRNCGSYLRPMLVQNC